MSFKQGVDEKRRAQGKKHHLPTILSLSVAAVLCGMVGYKNISLLMDALGQKARSRFRCRKREGKYEVPSRTVIRHALICVNSLTSPLRICPAVLGFPFRQGELYQSHSRSFPL